MHCIIGNLNPFSHCNFYFLLECPRMPCGNLFPFIVLENNNPNPK